MQFLENLRRLYGGSALNDNIVNHIRCIHFFVYMFIKVIDVHCMSVCME